MQWIDRCAMEWWVGCGSTFSKFAAPLGSVRLFHFHEQAFFHFIEHIRSPQLMLSLRLNLQWRSSCVSATILSIRKVGVDIDANVLFILLDSTTSTAISLSVRLSDQKPNPLALYSGVSGKNNEGEDGQQKSSWRHWKYNHPCIRVRRQPAIAAGQRWIGWSTDKEDTQESRLFGVSIHFRRNKTCSHEHHVTRVRC